MLQVASSPKNPTQLYSASHLQSSVTDLGTAKSVALKALHVIAEEDSNKNSSQSLIKTLRHWFDSCKIRLAHSTDAVLSQLAALAACHGQSETIADSYLFDLSKKFGAPQHLVRQATACEETQPTRAAKLYLEAAEVLTTATGSSKVGQALILLDKGISLCSDSKTTNPEICTQDSDRIAYTSLSEVREDSQSTPTSPEKHRIFQECVQKWVDLADKYPDIADTYEESVGRKHATSV